MTQSASGAYGLLILAGVTPLVLGALMTMHWRSSMVYRGFGSWVLADFSLGASYMLLAFSPAPPPLVSILVVNALGLFSLMLVFDGVETFFDRPPFHWFNSLLLVSSTLLLAHFTYPTNISNARILLTSLTFAALELQVARSLLVHAPASLQRISRTIAAVFIITAVGTLLRGAYIGVQKRAIDILSDPTLLVSVSDSIASATICTFYFILLNTARVELDLDETRQQLADSVASSRRELARLGLLDEVSQLIADSLDENEILQRTVQAVVDRFGYAEAAVCLPVEGDQLEVRAISGTGNTGSAIGFRQSVGEGIIGHVAQTRKAYSSSDIEQDHHYSGLTSADGSAAAVPIVSGGDLYGVFYVQSVERDAFLPGDMQVLRTLASHVGTAVNKARLHAGTQDHLVVMTTLHRISQIIGSSLELDRIFQTVLQLLQDTFGYTNIGIYLLDHDVLSLGAQVGYSEESLLSQVPVPEGVMGRTVQSRQMQFVRDVSQEPAFLRAAGDIASEISVPLFKKGNVMGVINVEASRQRPLTERDADVLNALAGPIAVAIDNAHLHAEAISLAHVDGLTGLLNRRTFDQTLHAEISRAARYDYPVSLLIIDIDEFKSVNDQWGHPAGDMLLRAVAALISRKIRTSDSAARYGGDEFAIILPNTLLADGVDLAERLRVATKRLGSEAGETGIPGGEYTISVGAASYPENAHTAEELLQAADHAELTAKKLGKDRVFAALTAG